MYLNTVFIIRNVFIIHRSLHSSRDAISDAPALYFVVPNKENVSRICQVRIY